MVKYGTRVSGGEGEGKDGSQQEVDISIIGAARPLTNCFHPLACKLLRDGRRRLVGRPERPWAWPGFCAFPTRYSR